ncbi:transposase, IS4 family [Bacteroides uniformis ATCC 8492]|uniref:Transposase, IS4 family n=2 Tax=Bacteroidales TaxID=171549 RepID=A0ABC9NAT4_BACUC|nr:transposase, IS4 family [Bacteroides uniformis ATCC 8492]
MNKGSHFNGQPAYGQLINLLDKSKILQISQEKGGERYVKHFDAWQHLLIMLYAVIKRFDSLREITDSMFPEARKLAHLGISMMPRRSTLSDANARRSEGIFEAIYRDLYKTYRNELSSDSRNNPSSSWINRLQIIDSTTISLFSNLIFTGVGRHPKTGKKKGGIKVHTNIHANEGVSSDIRFTSAATNDSFMLKPSNYTSGDIVALDRAYIDYAKFEELSRAGVIYVTKMKKNLVYEVSADTDIHDRKWVDGTSGTPCDIHEEGQRWRRYKAPCTHSHLRRPKEKRGQAHIPPHKRHGDERRGYCGNLPETLGDRAVVQADKAELPPSVLLRRKRQCHQNPDMDNPHRQPSTDGAEETHQTQLELLGIGNNGQNHVNVLRQPLHLPRRTRQRLVKTGSRGRIATQGTPALWIEGLTRQNKHPQCLSSDTAGRRIVLH